MRDEFVNSFIEEVKELLLQLEDNIIVLEKDPLNKDIINSIFRVMHTLKGSAGMVGFRNIQDFTHEFEGLYEWLREEHCPADGNIIDLTLRAKDMIMKMLNSPGEDIDPEILEDISQKCRAIISGEKNQVQNFESRIFLIVFRPDKGIFERGIDPDKTIADIKSQGDIHVIEHPGKKSWQKQKQEKICLAFWEIYLRTSAGKSEIEDSFLFYDKD